MAQFTLKKPYTMPIDEVREAAEGLASQLEAQHGIKSQWRGDRVRIKGKGIDGEMDFADGMIDISVNLGMMTSMFAPVIKREMQRYLDTHVT